MIPQVAASESGKAQTPKTCFSRVAGLQHVSVAMTLIYWKVKPKSVIAA